MPRNKWEGGTQKKDGGRKHTQALGGHNNKKRKGREATCCRYMVVKGFQDPFSIYPLGLLYCTYTQ